jgi:lipoyl synthase
MPKPEWLRIKIQGGDNKRQVEETLRKLSLHTVCEEAMCPNIMECFGKKTATFMILGRTCTRTCRFCNVEKGETEKVDNNEPANIALATKELGLKHVVITSVTRDDLPDGGASQFVNTINHLRNNNSSLIIEVLIPDLKGEIDPLKDIISAKPDIINHNIETVPSLYKVVRPQADYQRSLKVIENVKKYNSTIYTKSGIMLGLGENEKEVLGALDDLKKSGCDFLTIGQYLAPSKNHYPVIEYIHPDIFKKYKDYADESGFKFTASGPFVRSSYNAENVFKQNS